MTCKKDTAFRDDGEMDDPSSANHWLSQIWVPRAVGCDNSTWSKIRNLESWGDMFLVYCLFLFFFPACSAIGKQSWLDQTYCPYGWTRTCIILVDNPPETWDADATRISCKHIGKQQEIWVKATHMDVASCYFFSSPDVAGWRLDVIIFIVIGIGYIVLYFCFIYITADVDVQ